MPRRFKKPKGRSKAARQESHAKRRAEERFGVSVSDEDYRKIIKSIQEGKTESVEKQSNRVTLHRVKLSDGQEAIAAYDKTRKTVVTLMFDCERWTPDRIVGTADCENTPV